MRKSNSTTRVYFVGKEESPIVQTNGHAKPISRSEAHKFDKVSFMLQLSYCEFSHLTVCIHSNEFISRNGDVGTEAETAVSDKIKDIVLHLSLFSKSI